MLFQKANLDKSVLIIIALFIATSLYAEQNIQEGPNHKNPQTQNHSSGNTKSDIKPLQVEIIAIPIDKEAEKIAEQERQEKRKVNQTAFIISIITIIATFITMVLLTIQILVYYNQAKSMRRTLEHMEKTERPYIALDKIDREARKSGDSDRWRIGFIFKNIGKMPAIIGKCNVKKIKWEDAIEKRRKNGDIIFKAPDYSNLTKLGCSHTIASGSTFSTSGYSSDIIKHLNVAPSYIVFGTITYTDLTKKPYETKFAIKFSSLNGVYEIFGKGDYEKYT